MATVTYGLTSAGFVTKPQSQITTEIQSALQQVFGSNINLGPESNFGQFVGIMSEREALIWQLAEAVYASQYPGGAEGTSVDNILALNNLKRLLATPTRTNTTPLVQSNGVTLYGLVLRGTPGTVIPSGSIIQNQSSPPIQFTLDSTVTIAAAVNCLQTLFQSNTPTTGAFQLSLVDAAGNTVLSPSFPYNSQAQTTTITWASTPSSGMYSLALSLAGAVTNSATLNYNSTPSQIQMAINAISGYGSVTVSGTMPNFTINWGSVPNPNVSFNTNSTGVTATFLNSIQAGMNNIYDSVAGNYPYTDMIVTIGASGFNFQFGYNAVVGSNPSSGSMPQPTMDIQANTLQNGTTVTNLNVVIETQGALAQAIGSATCTVTGPNFAAAGSLNTIGSSISGWTGVTNQLDAITGTNVEDDTQALLRRSLNLNSQANGPLQAIVEKVRQVTNVITAIGFENLNEAALQVISYPIQPTSGAYQLILNGIVSSSIAYNASASAIQTALRAISGYSNILVTGSRISGFTVDFNGSFGGQPQTLMAVTNNTTGGTVSVAFGRPGKSFEIVVEGGDDTTIATTILDSKPAGIQSYGSTSVLVYDVYNNPYTISFSRPTAVPIYVELVLQTDLTTATTPTFNPQSISTIQEDIVSIINGVGIGGLVVGFGTNGIIGAFNAVPGILSYTLYFDRSQNPTTNTNVQMQSEEVPVAETFNIAVSYT